jgi:hypothetical protein
MMPAQKNAANAMRCFGNEADFLSRFAITVRRPLMPPVCLRAIECGCESSRFLCGLPPNVSWIGLKPEGVGTVVEVVLVVSVEIVL